MFRTLYSRLALTLFVLLCLVGAALVQLIGHASMQYQQEVAQKLNDELAQHIVKEYPLIQNDSVNREALDHLFHQLMVINPSIELYLLDETGQILGYSAPEGRVKRKQVTLGPVQEYLAGSARFPLVGDDPRSHQGQKVFSAARIKGDEGLQGYLYIVLGGELYDDVAQMLGSSYILDSALFVLLIALVAALLGGLLVFALLTRRLRLLGSAIRDYGSRNRESLLLKHFTIDEEARDEIDELGQQFTAMVTKINEQIVELQRMDSMRREMVANVSHDLRTPLTTMRGYLETLLLKEEQLHSDEKKQYLLTALDHSRYLGRLVDELFELARLDSCEAAVYAEAFSMSELVQDVCQSFQLRAKEKSIDLQANLNPEVPQTYGDIAMMQRVLENLLENGLRHTPENGKISVSVDSDSSTIRVQVTDSGRGIPEEEVSKIFERFYKPSIDASSGEGAGLGLAIVKRILELHDGVIDVSSEIGRGTTFAFQLSTRQAAT